MINITKYGHPLWYLLFHFGFYKLILDFDKANKGLPEKINN